MRYRAAFIALAVALVALAVIGFVYAAHPHPVQVTP